MARPITRTADGSLAAVIFDVDGVLIASPHERAWREALDDLMRGAWRTLAKQTSYRPGAFTTEVYQSRVAGKPRLSGATALLQYFGVHDVTARALEYADAKQRRIEALIAAGEFVAFDDAVELATALFEAGYPLAAASSSKNANEAMRRIDLKPRVDRARVDAGVLGGPSTLLDLFSVNVCGREVAKGKPGPDLFLLAAAELGISAAHCVVIEDAPSGIAAAKAGGMRAFGIARLQDEQLLLAAGADMVSSWLDAEVLAPLLAAASVWPSPGPSDSSEEQWAGSETPSREPAFSITEQANWVLRETSYNRSRERSIEARFAVSNGFLGVRASRAVSRGPAWISWQHTLSWSSWPRTYVAGLFDTPNADPPVPALVPAPDWLRLRLIIDGAPLLLRFGELVRHWRTLEMRRGLLITDWHQRQPDGRLVRLRTLRLVSLADRAVALQLMELFVDGPPAEVTLDSLFEVGSTGLEIVSVHPELAILQTGLSRKRLAIASTASLTQAESELPPTAHDQFFSWSWRWRSQPGGRARLARIVAFARGDERDNDVERRAVTALARANEIGWHGVLDQHVAAWADRWSSSDIEIVGDDAAQRAIRFAVYHLISAANPDDDRVSIGARALTGDAYLGHVFWDTEIYLLPFYTLTWPEAARALLMYRYATLDGARAKASHMGYRGALYAWESADTGEEVTPDWVQDPEGRVIEVLCGKQEQHISADVAYAVWQYWQATGDDAFFCEAGAEIMLETARFWASRARLEQDGQYHIRCVIGPDEYHEHIDDNAFTNVMARWNIARGLEVVEVLTARWPERMRELEQRLRLDSAERAAWGEVAHGLVTGFEAASRLFEQFEGYFNLEDIDLTAYADRTQPMDVVLGRERTQHTSIVKQADVVALLALLPDAYDREVDEANFRYYEPRCGHGSSLSRALHALVAARLGDVDLAYRYFCESAAIDLADTTGSSAGGVRIAALGGLWQIAAFGFAGLSLRADGLVVDPHLPPQWRSLRLRVQWRGRKLALRLAAREVQATLESGEPLPLSVGGRRVTIEAGSTERLPVA
ncbi:MAG TPA: HAD-IA family hydrolase [Burkholderiales bacterium]|nr:HAD-IA family hydrolase [Burkholderiales bacterium]